MGDTVNVLLFLALLAAVGFLGRSADTNRYSVTQCNVTYHLLGRVVETPVMIDQKTGKTWKYVDAGWVSIPGGPTE